MEEGRWRINQRGASRAAGHRRRGGESACLPALTPPGSAWEGEAGGRVGCIGRGQGDRGWVQTQYVWEGDEVIGELVLEAFLERGQ